MDGARGGVGSRERRHEPESRLGNAAAGVPAPCGSMRDCLNSVVSLDRCGSEARKLRNGFFYLSTEEYFFSFL